MYFSLNLYLEWVLDGVDWIGEMCTETFQVVNRTYNAEQFHQKVDKVVTYGLDFFYLFAMIGSAQGR